ncbi:MAG: serine/threonine protein kinase [Deltaproteobacteria bacterium]|nr:serine/threonine protein kinase [Deltaproteobacteria bacterium]
MDPASIPTSLGEFRIVAELGRGGSGVVYDASWGPRRVALKVLHPSLVTTERLRAQFLAEATRLQTITHSSVVKVLAVGELPDGRPYLAMERLDGETLASVLARGPMELPDALAIFGELCSAVGALHDRNLVHRDLKPENVFIVGGQHGVLLDFGIAKELEAPDSTTTMDGGVRGTPAYMAPERFFGQPAGVATDIYELAVTLYAMLAGRLPWDDLNDPEARLAPRPLVEFAAVPAELDIEIRRAMSTRAQNRPESAKALLEAARGAAGAPALAPGAADTARMAPTPDLAKPTVTAQRQPWFAGRQRTTDRGKTPLAWAPSDPASVPESPTKRRRRWPLVAGAMALALAIGGALAWRPGGGGPSDASDASLATASLATAALVDASVLAPAHDPWGAAQPASPPASAAAAPVERPAVSFTTSGSELSIPDARKEIAAALVHVPADTGVLFSVAIGELRKNEQFAVILGKIANNPQVAPLKQLLPPCVVALLAASEWAVYAARSLDESEHGTVMIRGRWNRAEVEQCFAPDSIPLAMPDGKQMLQLRRVGWLDFVDDHTVYISVRDDLAAAQVHDLVKHGSGAAPHTKQLLASLPADRTLAVAIDGSSGASWPKQVLPRSSDATVWLRVGPETEFGVVADPHSEAEATKVVASTRPLFDDLINATGEALGRITVERKATAMHLHGKMSALMIAMLIAAIP